MKCRISKNSNNSKIVRGKIGTIIDCEVMNEQTEEYIYTVRTNGVIALVHSDNVTIL